MMGDWGRKLDKRSINEKPPELNEKIWEKTEKLCIMRKNLPILTRIGKKKPEDQ